MARTKKVIDYKEGDKIAKCIFLHEVNSVSKHRKALFRCHCGNDFVAAISKIKDGETDGCGCRRRIVAMGKKRNLTHGLRRSTPLYGVWCSIKARCYTKSCACYSDYGGRGVKVCDEWRNDFKAFYDWCMANGWQKGLELDKDFKGDGLLYSPDTCTFVTRRQNCNKRRSSAFITFEGQTKTKADWSRELNVPYATLHTWINRGLSFHEIIKRSSDANN